MESDIATSPSTLTLVCRMLGSLALLVYGMKLMSDTLQQMAGPGLRHLLGRMTTNRFTGMLTGIVVTASVQSSTATTVMTVSFVNAGLLTLAQAISVIMGANIGTTLTAWVMSAGFAFNITNLVWPAFIAAMVLIYRKRHETQGLFLFGMAFLFLGLGTLRQTGIDMAIFAVYAVVFLVFEDYDRNVLHPLSERSDWYLLAFSVIVMAAVGMLLHRYARRMDQRISREQAAKENIMRRELTQNIAHEFKTPVASIMGFADTLLATPTLSEEQKRHFMQRIYAQTQRLAALLRDIAMLNRMDYAAAQPIQRERIDVAEMVAAIVTDVTPAAETRQMHIHNCLPHDISLHANPDLVYSIFRNLLDNAIAYAGTHTTVRLTARRKGSRWHFAVTDNGIGVAPEHLPRLFERFYRTDKGRSRQQGGTGLGLAIVKNAVLLHGGTIAASLVPSGGLRIDFSLNR